MLGIASLDADVMFRNGCSWKVWDVVSDVASGHRVGRVRDNLLPRSLCADVMWSLGTREAKQREGCDTQGRNVCLPRL
eukprot:3603660-Rhodomonas_salina.3